MQKDALSHALLSQARFLISAHGLHAGFGLQAPGGEGVLHAHLREALARGLAGQAVTPEQRICAEMLAQSKTRLVLTLTISSRRSVIAFWRSVSSCRILLPHCTRTAFPQMGGRGRAWRARIFPSSMAQLPVLLSAAHQLSSCCILSHLLPYPELPLQGYTKRKIVGSKCCWENVEDWQSTKRGCWIKKGLEGLK